MVARTNPPLVVVLATVGPLKYSAAVCPAPGSTSAIEPVLAASVAAPAISVDAAVVLPMRTIVPPARFIGGVIQAIRQVGRAGVVEHQRPARGNRGGDGAEERPLVAEGEAYRQRRKDAPAAPDVRLMLPVIDGVPTNVVPL